MRFAVAVAAAGLAAVAHAGSNDTYVTEVVTQLTTYCPEATQITHNGQTYTITEATTLTITNCPCTVTKPVYSSVVTACNTCSSSSAAPTAPVYSAPSSPAAPVQTSSAPSAPAYSSPVQSSAPSAPAYSAPASSAPSAPVYSSPASSSAPVVAPYPSSNGTTPVSPIGTGKPAGSASGSAPSASGPASYTGSASKVSFGAAGVLAALGLVAAL